MRRFIIFTFILTTPLFFTSCEKEPGLLDVLDEMTFSCEDYNTDYYFEGFINGEKVCFHAGFDDYDIYLRQSTGFTSGPTINTGEANTYSNGSTWGEFSIQRSRDWKHLDQSFYIETPKFEAGVTTLDSIVKASIKSGELPLALEGKSNESFNIQFSNFSKYGYEGRPGGQFLHLQSLGGKQHDSYLEVTELEIEEFGDKFFYTVTFEFECDLYIAGSADDRYGRLEDGIFRVAFSLDK